MVMSMEASSDQAVAGGESPMEDSALSSQAQEERAEKESPTPVDGAPGKQPEAMVMSREPSFEEDGTGGQPEAREPARRSNKLLLPAEEISIKNDPLVARMREFVEGTGSQQQHGKSSSGDSLNGHSKAAGNGKASMPLAQQKRSRHGRCARHHNHHHHHHHHHHLGHQQQRASVSSNSAAHIHKQLASGANPLPPLQQRRHHHHHHHQHHHHQQQQQQVAVASSESNQAAEKRQSDNVPSESNSSASSSATPALVRPANQNSSAETTNENSPREPLEPTGCPKHREQQLGHHHHHHHQHARHHHHRHHHRTHKKRIVSEEAGQPAEEARQPADQWGTLQEITNQSSVCCPYHGTGSDQFHHHHQHHCAGSQVRAISLKHDHHQHHHHGQHSPAKQHQEPELAEGLTKDSDDLKSQHHRLHHHHHHHHHHGHHHHHHHHRHSQAGQAAARQRPELKDKSSSNVVASGELQEAAERRPSRLAKEQQSEGESRMHLDEELAGRKRTEEEEARSPAAEAKPAEVVTMELSPTGKQPPSSARIQSDSKTASNLESSAAITSIELLPAGAVEAEKPSAQTASLAGSQGKGAGEYEAAKLRAQNRQQVSAGQERIQRQSSSSRENSQKGRAGEPSNRSQQADQQITIECSPAHSNTFQQQQQQQQEVLPRQIIESTVPPDRRCRLCWCCCCPCSGLSNKSNAIKSEAKPSAEAPTATAEKCPTIPNVSLEEIRSWGESFDRLMKCQEGRKVFQDFLRCEYSEENILFWIACEELKSEKDAKSIATKARDIYEDYISILSAKEVSLDSRVREIINSNIKKPGSNIFDEAQLQIYTLMHRDSYPRFLNSAMYKKLAQIQTTSRKSSS